MWRLGIGLMMVLLAVGACGRDKAGDGIATAGGAQPRPSASARAAEGDLRTFAQCMRNNGIDMPDPDPSTGRPPAGTFGNDNRDAFQKAMQVCRSLLPNGGVRPTMDAAQLEQFRQFAQCMRDNGVDMPDPDPNGGGFGVGARIDRDSPTFQKARDACRAKLPQVRR